MFVGIEVVVCSVCVCGDGGFVVLPARMSIIIYMYLI